MIYLNHLCINIEEIGSDRFGHQMFGDPWAMANLTCTYVIGALYSTIVLYTRDSTKISPAISLTIASQQLGSIG